MSWMSYGGSNRARTGLIKFAAVSVAALLAIGSTPASAQDLVQHFIDPSFGGNPFYSDHLLATAAINRPAAPTTPSTTPTQEELIAQQLRAQLLSQLSGTILDRIQNAKAGDSGSFTVGNQQISFVRTATENTITFTDPTTGQTNTVVLPVSSSSSATAAGSTSAAAALLARSSAEQALGVTSLAAGASTGATAATSRLSVTGGTTSRSAEQALLAPASGAGSTLAPF